MVTRTDAFRTNFDGDGSGGGSFGDLVLSQDSGLTAIWLMDENQRAGTGTSLPNNGPNWHIRAAADFDRGAGSGFSDLLWQSNDGQVAIWQMQGTQILNQTNITRQDPSWHIRAVDDFDNNGAADIVFQNDTGELGIWRFVNATSVPPDIASIGVEGGQTRIFQNPGAPWHVVATGDTNGDGRSGILFQHADTGDLAIWEDFALTLQAVPIPRFPFLTLAGGGAFLTQANLRNPGPGWHVQGMGDFDGDGRADIVLQHDNGAAAIWLMDGTQIRAGGDLNITPFNGPTWHIAGVRDMNNDGRADLIWQNDNGASAVWANFTTNGGNATFASQHDIVPQPDPNPAPPVDWHIVA